MKLGDKIKKLIILLGINIAIILVIALIKRKVTDIMFIRNCMFYLATANLAIGLLIKSSGNRKIANDRIIRGYYSIGSRRSEEKRLDEESEFFKETDSITGYFIGSGAILLVIAMI